jgi:triacylglycerol lipase
MNTSIQARIAALGDAVTVEMVGGTRKIFVPLQKPAPPGVSVQRDHRYGEHERHRLDLFIPPGAKGAPTLLFVHGGGFVQGDKTTPGSPFYDNVGYWAASQGIIGATMTYRLAPQFRWPCGADDVRDAVRWLRGHVGASGGDPDRIVVMGQSAGAVHVASYVAREHGEGAGGWHPAGAILASGLYDLPTMERNPLFESYFGGAGADASFMAALAGTGVPLLMIIAERDPEDFQRQGAYLLKAFAERRRAWPRVWQAQGDNHVSTVLQINSEQDGISGTLHEFIAHSTTTRA